MSERMKTEFSQFCEGYAKVLQPLRGILRDSVENLRDKPDADALKPALSGLTDLHHRLKNLLDKVEDQQAYVIIFGPLKSGKSTLMNAISSAYVSEVSSLPAYPCLVYVRHADDPEILVTKYNGRIEEYADSARMQEVITDHHQELADRIRQTEDLGEVFDPSSHFTEAIRRIDIGLPAETLKTSYTVLVDTPGLYSRMRFGYDLMTREFRDSAACAVFVVKTDNLFLEQVFEEFNDLLDLFSRIFLVVNIDTNKRDLGPDGELHPSLESRHPDRIVEAFRSLSMSAPLRRACDEGRLKIYPIDLLNSAAASLQGGSANGSDAGEAKPEPFDFLLKPKPQDGAAESAVGPGTIWTGFAAIVPAPPGPGTIWAGFRPAPTPSAAAAGSDSATPTFDGFLADLTDYLNSNDYLINFMRDSLRQGHTLLAEVQDHVSAECLGEFRTRLADLEQEVGRQQQRRDAVARLDEVDWPSAFVGSRDVCEADGEQFAEAEKQRLHSDLSGRVDQWFTTDESLEDLLRDHVRPGIDACVDRIRKDAGERIQRLTGGSRCGAELGAETVRAMDTAGLSLAEIQTSDSIHPDELKPADVTYDDSISLASLPVRKTIWDWLLCRTLAKVRRRTFGPNEQPDHPIPAKVKASRLGDVGKLALEEEISAMLDRAFPGVSKRLSGDLLEQYANRFSDAIAVRLDKTRTELDQTLPRLRDRIDDAREILATLDQLSADASQVQEGVDKLERGLAQSHPPAEPPAPGAGDDDSSDGLLDGGDIDLVDDFVRMPSLLDDDDPDDDDQARPVTYRPAVGSDTLTSVWVAAARTAAQPPPAASIQPDVDGNSAADSDPGADTVKLIKPGETDQPGDPRSGPEPAAGAAAAGAQTGADAAETGPVESSGADNPDHRPGDSQPSAPASPPPSGLPRPMLVRPAVPPPPAADRQEPGAG